MLFFHDMAIKNYFGEFIYSLISSYNDIPQNKRITEAQVLILPEFNPYFNWWMRLSATNLKNKINIINSLELRKDIAAIDVDLQKFIDEFKIIIQNIPDKYKYDDDLLKVRLEEIGNQIFVEYAIYNTRNQYAFKNYILNITTEITTYAEGVYYATADEDIEKRDELVQNVITELQNF